MPYNESKMNPDGRYEIYDSFEEFVEATDDLDYAKQRARENDGWVEQHGTMVFYANLED